jgi:tRNA threonylcarbamoyladenosine biosynthesis protein TsaE
METKRIQSLEEMESFAQHLVLTFKRGEKALLITLQGDLGAGKTAFVKGCAKAFGVMEIITSPTFVIEKIYTLNNQVFDRLIHIDAYRLESAEELARLGWQDIVEDPKNIIFLEWPERVAEILPKERVEIKFTFIDENTREVEYLAW